MDDTRDDTLQRIRESVARQEYPVEPAAVAEAILRRLLAGRALDTRPEERD